MYVTEVFPYIPIISTLTFSVALIQVKRCLEIPEEASLKNQLLIFGRFQFSVENAYNVNVLTPN